LANALRIVRWRGEDWSVLGGGLNGAVSAINNDSSGNIYIGGDFTDAGGISEADYIVKWGKKY